MKTIILTEYTPDNVFPSFIDNKFNFELSIIDKIEAIKISIHDIDKLNESIYENDNFLLTTLESNNIELLNDKRVTKFIIKQKINHITIDSDNNLNIDDIVKLLTKTPSIKTLDLQFSNIVCNTLAPSNILPLENITLDRCIISHFAFSILMIKSNNLKYLKIINSNLTKIYINNMNSNNYNINKLESIEITHSDNFAQIITTIIPNENKIQHLTINYTHNHLKNLKNIKALLNNIKQLKLTSRFYNHDHIYLNQIINTPDKLESINIANISKIMLHPSLMKNNFENIAEVILKNTQISDMLLSTIINQATKLLKISLDNCNIKYSFNSEETIESKLDCILDRDKILINIYETNIPNILLPYLLKYMKHPLNYLNINRVENIINSISDIRYPQSCFIYKILLNVISVYQIYFYDLHNKSLAINNICTNLINDQHISKFTKLYLLSTVFEDQDINDITINKGLQKNKPSFTTNITSCIFSKKRPTTPIKTKRIEENLIVEVIKI